MSAKNSAGDSAASAAAGRASRSGRARRAQKPAQDAAAPSAAAAAGRARRWRSGLRRLYRNEVNFDFPRLWRRSIVLSLVVLLIAGGAWLFRGLNLGIEFEGGVTWEAQLGDVSVAEVRESLIPLGHADSRIQQLAGGATRVRAELSARDTAEVEAVKRALAELGGLESSEVSTSAVGASWGGRVTSSARNALIVFFIVVAIYIWLRLEWKMSLAALLAVGHDIVVTVGIYALFGIEVTPATVIAFLTILAYSLYDTLVVFDRIRENANRLSDPYQTVVVRSVNEVFMRSVNTTITSVLPVLSLLIIGRFVLGAVTLQEFSLALLIGLLAGTYSSLFVAAPALAWLHGLATGERIRWKAGTSEGGAGTSPSVVRSPAPPAPPAPRSKRERSQGGPVAETKVTTQRTHPPRPRKKKRK